MDLTDSAPNGLDLARMNAHMKDYEFRKANERRANDGLPALTRQEYQASRSRRFHRPLGNLSRDA